MKLFFTSLLFVACIPALANVPDLPPNACYEGCTPFMSDLLKEFETEGVLPDAVPNIYSGECRHLGNYDSNDVHYASVLLDIKNSQWNFSTIFAFFEGYNSFADWNLETARKEMSPWWNDHGDIKTGSNAARVIVPYENGAPAYIYWMRQNPKTKQLLYITFAGYAQTSFCRLNQHPN